MKKNYRKKNNDPEKFDLFFLKDWDEFQEIQEEELEDLMEEFNIPEIGFIEPTDKPEDLTFN